MIAGLATCVDAEDVGVDDGNAYLLLPVAVAVGLQALFGVTPPLDDDAPIQADFEVFAVGANDLEAYDDDPPLLPDDVEPCSQAFFVLAVADGLLG